MQLWWAEETSFQNIKNLKYSKVLYVYVCKNGLKY